VTAARAADCIRMNESNFCPGSGYEKYTKTVPQTASVIGWGFQDTTDFSGTVDFTTVRFDA
jgi:hypothetical protein